MTLSLKANPTPPRGNEWSAAHLGRYAWACNSRKGPVLDAACGAGQGTQLLTQNHDYPVVGMDINPEAILFAAHYCNQGVVSYVVGDVEEGLEGFEGFETIVCIETIEHLKRPDKALANFRKLLPIDGYLIITTPNADTYPFIHSEHYGDPYPHQRHYTKDEMTDLLATHGFEVQFCMTQRGEIHYKNGKKTGKSMNPGMEIGHDGLFLGFVAHAV